MKVDTMKPTIGLMITMLCGRQHTNLNTSRYHILWHDKHFVFRANLQWQRICTETPWTDSGRAHKVWWDKVVPCRHRRGHRAIGSWLKESAVRRTARMLWSSSTKDTCTRNGNHTLTGWKKQTPTLQCPRFHIHDGQDVEDGLNIYTTNDSCKSDPGIKNSRDRGAKY